ncbi:MAG: nucleotide exchange factor GrpE [Planctomycetes bacterium]|nr:nucleotide exchange factor GrpE [Planctomycetota bacterium]
MSETKRRQEKSVGEASEAAGTDRPVTEDARFGAGAPEEPGQDAQLKELTARLDEALAARKRALADFANYQRRAAETEAQAAEAGVARVVRSLLGVLDHFDLALDQRSQEITLQQLLGGVKMARDELLKALASHGLQRLQPSVGEEFDPHRHEAVMREPAGDVASDHIVSVVQTGYMMGEMVLRPAKVTVAAEPQPDGGD